MDDLASVTQAIADSRRACPSSQLRNMAYISPRDCQALLDMEERLEVAREDCLTRLVAVIKLHSDVVDQLRVVRSALAPIRRLNHDVLAAIFLSIASSYKDPFESGRFFARTISRVCFEWYAVCTATPGLWTHLALTRGSICGTPWDHFAKQVALCGALPIHIRWDLSESLEQLFAFGESVDNPIHSLELNGTWKSVPALCHPTLAKAERLLLSLSGSRDWDALSVLNVMPNLSHVTIRSDDRYLGLWTEQVGSPILEGLVHLHLDVLQHTPFSVLSRLLIGGSRTLTVLKLSWGVVYPESPLSLGRFIFLPCLTKLVLARSACALMLLLQVPNVSTIRLSDVRRESDAYGCLLCVLGGLLAASHSGPRVTTLSLAHADPRLVGSVKCVRGCFGLMTNLTNLTVTDMATESVTTLAGLVARGMSGAPVVPSLRSASFSHGFHRSPSSVIKAVRALERDRSAERLVGGQIVAAIERFHTNMYGDLDTDDEPGSSWFATSDSDSSV